MLLVVTDWQLLLISAVGENLIGASVFGFLLYGAYRVSMWIFGHESSSRIPLNF
jgi:nitric oxide reductase large subunit